MTQKRLRITVGGKAYDVTVEVLENGSATVPAAAVAPTMPAPAAAPRATTPAPSAAAPVGSSPAPSSGGAGTLTAPLAGIIISVDVKVGDSVGADQQVVMMEAMKMQTPIYAPKAGTVKDVRVNAGDTVTEGTPLLIID